MIKEKYVVIKDCPSPINAKKIIAIKGDVILQCDSKEINHHINNGVEIQGKIPKEYLTLYDDWLILRKTGIATEKSPEAKTPTVKTKKQRLTVIEKIKQADATSKESATKINISKAKKWQLSSFFEINKKHKKPHSNFMVETTMWISENSGFYELFKHSKPICLFYKECDLPKIENDLEEIRSSDELNPSQFEYVHPLEENVDALEITPSKKWPKRVAKLDEDRAKQIRIYILMNPNLSEQKIADNFLVSQNTIRLLKHGNIYRDAIPTKEDILALQSPKSNSPDWLISDELYGEVCYGDFDTSGDGYTDYFLEAGLITDRDALWQIKYHRHPWGTEEYDCPFCRYVNQSGYNIYETDTYTCKECKKEFNTLTGTHVDGIEISYAQLWRFAWFVSKRMDHFKIIAQQLRISEDTSKKLLLILENEGKVDTWEYWKKENEVLDILLGPINKVNGIFNVKVEVEPGKWPQQT